MLQITYDIIRNFDLDYLIFDLIFFLIFLTVLIIKKKRIPIYVGLICGILFLIIDGIIWWNIGVREINPPEYKFVVDFMMDFSYGFIAFSWVMIMFERNNLREIVLWTVFVYCGWLITASLSQILPFLDLEITTNRHMRSLRIVEIVTVIIGFLLLIFLKYDYKTILFIFCIGFMLSFMMESYLLITRMRPSGFELLLYDSLILTNQGIPYLYVFFDKILPKIKDTILKNWISKDEKIDKAHII
ncbi:MAG: hypothetical protein ACFFC3_03680 [Candidatus Odinarchaeota archaeon]